MSTSKMSETEFGHRIVRSLKHMIPDRIMLEKTTPGMYSGVGMPDYIGVGPNGKFLGIEMKVYPGRFSDEQMTWMKQVNKRGGIAIGCVLMDDGDALVFKPVEKPFSYKNKGDWTRVKAIGPSFDVGTLILIVSGILPVGE